MAKRKKLNTVQIVSDHGNVTVEGKGLHVRYRYKYWLLHLNPVFVPRGIRKEHQKVIYVNGKRYGYGEVCSGAIPLPEYRYAGNGLGIWFRNFTRDLFGWFSRRSEFGYIRVKLKRNRYIILKSYTEAGNLYCRVFDEYSGEALATLLFDAKFDALYPSIEYEGWLSTALTIVGYVADVLIYSSVAEQLNKAVAVMW